MKTLSLFLLILFFVGCDDEVVTKPDIKIAVSNWVGYTPLFYAQQKGMLDKLGIKIVPTTSLGASLEFTKSGLVDGLCGTQMEYESLEGRVVPVVTLDRSNGGDMILSNLPREQLYGLENQKLDVYLEYESINYLVWKYFKESRKWGNIEFVLKSNTQSYIADLRFENPTIVVTYHPYASKHINNGLHTITTTKEGDLLVIDALFVTKNSLKKNKAHYQMLKKAIQHSIQALHDNPQEYYQTIHKYLQGQTYDEFIQSLKDIEWMVETNATQRGILTKRGVDMSQIL